jgi:hypothetical protein
VPTLGRQAFEPLPHASKPLLFLGRKLPKVVKPLPKALLLFRW